jgi:crotonobetainyl-CoA:carnitine CoA-transferase CaiB-like acyl-CoA transferase
VWLNRGKESLELDFKTAEGRAVLDALLARADVFLHNISPAAAKRQGLDSTALRAQFPRLITGSVSGYGSGPMADSKAYDLLVQGETGLISLTGTEEYPAKVGISIADISAGMYAYASTLAAIHHRDRSGEVLTVDISLFDSLTEWLGYPLLYTMHRGQAPARVGTSHATIAPYGAFDTSTGEILLAVQNGYEWARFCGDVLVAPELENDPRFVTNALRVANMAALTKIVNGSLNVLDRTTVAQRLDDAGIANARLNHIEDLEGHEQLSRHDRWTQVQTEVGPVNTVKPPWVPDGRNDEYGPVPSLGEHTEQIRAWLGFEPVADRQLARLARDGEVT